MLQRKKILLVDDDRDILGALAGILSDEGYQVRQAAGWKDLFKILNSECMPDLIILDLMIPYFSGFELLRSLKSNISRYKHIPVIAISAMGTDAEETAVKSGAAAFLPKPFDLLALLAAIERLSLAG